jgi:uncharacterized membrane protein YfcA
MPLVADPFLWPLLLGALIGLVLALTGAGGGVLSIPLLVFGLNLPLQQAAPVGLLAVGLACGLGAALGLRQGIVRYRAALLMGAAGMLSAPAGVLLAQQLPNRPLMGAFALVLIYSAWRMLRRASPNQALPEAVPCRVSLIDQRLSWTLPCARALGGTGLVSGLMSGLFGVGGGFVIVPALSRYTDLNPRSIQRTSLAVIALVSLSGVSAAVMKGALPWAVALPVALGAVVALLAGQALAGKLNEKSLQQAFAWLTLAVAMLMFAKSFGWTT